MDMRKMARFAALAIVLVFVLALVAEHVDAAKGDAAVGAKKGGKGAEEEDDARKPKTWQVGLGLGSVVVAFFVIKWL